MLTIEMRINGSPVSVITAVNRGLADSFECTYEYSIATFPIHLNGPPVCKHGKLAHARSRGINELALRLLQVATNGD